MIKQDIFFNQTYLQLTYIICVHMNVVFEIYCLAKFAHISFQICQMVGSLKHQIYLTLKCFNEIFHKMWQKGCHKTFNVSTLHSVLYSTRMRFSFPQNWLYCIISITLLKIESITLCLSYYEIFQYWIETYWWYVSYWTDNISRVKTKSRIIPKSTFLKYNFV